MLPPSEKSTDDDDLFLFLVNACVSNVIWYLVKCN